MICRSCKKKAYHIKVIGGTEICENCGGFSVAGGTKTDGLLTRNRFSVRRDSIMYEGDTLPPHEYDKHSKKFKPREDFIKRFPDKVNDTYSKEELKSMGLKKEEVNNKDSDDIVAD